MGQVWVSILKIAYKIRDFYYLKLKNNGFKSRFLRQEEPNPNPSVWLRFFFFYIQNFKMRFMPQKPIDKRKEQCRLFAKRQTKKPLRASLEALSSLSNIAPQRLLSIGMWNK